MIISDPHHVSSQPHQLLPTEEKEKYSAPKKGVLCPVCYKIISKKSNLKVHLRSVHQKLRPYKCETCGRAFTQLRVLKDHVKRLHQTSFLTYWPEG